MKRLKYATVVFDGALLCSDLKVIEGEKDSSYQCHQEEEKDGPLRLSAHPLNADTCKTY